MEYKCESCTREVQDSWKYCRYCGKVQPKREQRDTDEKIDISEQTTEISEIEIKFNKDLYFKVLSTRSHRSKIIKEKKEVLNSVNSLLEQVQSGLVTREYALPKIKELKNKVTALSEEEKKYEDLPDKLPLEVLLDEIDAANTRLRKLDDLKSDPAITKETIREAKVQSEESLKLLKDQQSMINGHLRNWQADLKSKLNSERKELEHLYIRVKTGEIIEETYEERKTEKSIEITTMDGVLKLVSRMLE